MNKVIISVETDKETKKEAQIWADGLGLTLSAFIEAQLKWVLKKSAAPLDNCPVVNMDSKTEKVIEKFYEEKRRGQISQSYKNIDEMFKDL